MSLVLRTGVLGLGLLVSYYVGKYVYNLLEAKFLKDPVRECSRPVGKFDGENITMCLVCLEKLELDTLLALPCKHKFHTQCLQELLNYETCPRICPACRAHISEEFIEMKLRTQVNRNT